MDFVRTGCPAPARGRRPDARRVGACRGDRCELPGRHRSGLRATVPRDLPPHRDQPWSRPAASAVSVDGPRRAGSPPDADPRSAPRRAPPAMARVRRDRDATTISWLDRRRPPRPAGPRLRRDRDPVRAAAHRTAPPVVCGEGRFRAFLGRLGATRRGAGNLAPPRRPGLTNEPGDRGGGPPGAADRLSSRPTRCARSSPGTGRLAGTCPPLGGPRRCRWLAPRGATLSTRRVARAGLATQYSGPRCSVLGPQPSRRRETRPFKAIHRPSLACGPSLRRNAHESWAGNPARSQ